MKEEMTNSQKSLSNNDPILHDEKSCWNDESADGCFDIIYHVAVMPLTTAEFSLKEMRR